MISYYKYIFFIFTLLLFSSCTEEYNGGNTPISDVPLYEVAYSGYVKDSSGYPLSGVAVTLRYQNKTVYSGSDGLFSFQGVLSKNDTIIIKKDGYYDGIYSYNGATNSPQNFTLRTDSSDNVRLLFTGDLSFARRFMDPASPDRTTQLITQDVPDATLKVSDLYGTGQAVIDPIRPLFHSVDFPTVNFESIATRSQATLDTIHPTKDFAYYTNDLSLALLKDLNINFVSLGNNHVFDYNNNGLSDTLNALDNNGINHSGAGVNVDEAFAPYRTTIKSTEFSFVGATSIRGDKHSLLYVAHENSSNADDPFATQGGAADAHDTARVSSRLTAENEAGYFPIYQFHGGIEYTQAPNSVALKLMKEAVKSKAGLVVSHHPHSAQGYGMKDGVLMAYGMGNFIFDQDRLDTLLSHIFVCDVKEKKVVKASGYPIYIEDYIPKLLTGDTANRFIRQISEASRNGSTLLETTLESDFMVFPYQYKEYLSLNNKYKTQTQTVEVDIDILDKGYEIVDLRHLLPSEYSLSAVEVDSDNLAITVGRDLLWFGSFEDDDVDQDVNEHSIWNFGEGVASSSVAHTGKVSAHILRDESHYDPALLYFGRRIRVIGDARNQPNKNLSFFGYFKGIDSRPFTVESQYYASIGELEFGSSLLISQDGGTFEWEQFDQTIPLPADGVSSNEPTVYLSQNARSLKLYIRMLDTQKGSSHLYVDDLAVINWEEAYINKKSIKLSTPHAREFLKLKGRSGSYRLKLEFKKYIP